MASEQRVQFARGLPGVERPPDRRLVDAIHHCCTGRFDGGDSPQIFGQASLELVDQGLADVAEHGNGAMRQRRAWRRRHDVRDVLAVAAEATLEF